MKELLALFLVFARMGAFTFGGGYAMLPIIQREIVEKKKWATDDEVIDYYAIGQCTPGIIAINVATFIGYRRRGIPGAIVSTLGMVFPSFLIITIIAAFFTHFQDYAVVQHAFSGVRIVVVALIIQTIIKMWKQSIKNWIGIVLFGVSFLVIAFTSLSPIYVIIFSAVVGIVTMGKKEAELQ